LNKAIAQMETMIENVPGLLSRKFEVYRTWIKERLCGLGYETRIELLNAADFGVPQHWLRVFIIGLKPQYVPFFRRTSSYREKNSLDGYHPAAGQGAGSSKLARSAFVPGWKGPDRFPRLSHPVGDGFPGLHFRPSPRGGR